MQKETEQQTANLLQSQDSLLSNQMMLKDEEANLKRKLDNAIAQSNYFEKKSQNMQEACEWLQNKLNDAEQTILEKQKRIATFENIQAANQGSLSVSPPSHMLYKNPNNMS